MRHGALAVLLIGLAAHGTSALAAGPSRPLPGYRCMMLNLTERQSMDPGVHVDVLDAPSPSAHPQGMAGSVVAVTDPAIRQDGYVRMVMANGRPGWIRESMLRPYHSLGDPSARCRPVVLPSGVIGFGPG